MHDIGDLINSRYALLKFGVISEFDGATGYARVNFDEDDDDDGGAFVSQPLPILTRKAQDCKEIYPFDIGEQVICLMDEQCEQGAILGALFNDKDAPDGGDGNTYRIKYKDGSFEQFNRSTGNKEVNYKGGLKSTTAADTEFDFVTGKFISSSGAKHEIASMHKLENAVENFGSLLKDVIDVVQNMQYVNGAGNAIFNPAGLPILIALKARVDSLFD